MFILGHERLTPRRRLTLNPHGIHSHGVGPVRRVISGGILVGMSRREGMGGLEAEGSGGDGLADGVGGDGVTLGVDEGLGEGGATGGLRGRSRRTVPHILRPWLVDISTPPCDL